MSRHRYHWDLRQHVTSKLTDMLDREAAREPLDLSEIARQIIESVRARSHATLTHENNRLRSANQQRDVQHHQDQAELTRARRMLNANDASLRLAGDEIRALHAQLNRVHALREQARAVSAGPRAVIYVADLEAALGISGAPAPSKLGQNEQADPTHV